MTRRLCVMRPILSRCSSSTSSSVNQRAPSGPAAIPMGSVVRPGESENSVIAPVVVIRPILFLPSRQFQTR